MIIISHIFPSHVDPAHLIIVPVYEHANIVSTYMKYVVTPVAGALKKFYDHLYAELNARRSYSLRLALEHLARAGARP